MAPPTQPAPSALCIVERLLAALMPLTGVLLYAHYGAISALAVTSLVTLFILVLIAQNMRFHGWAFDGEKAFVGIITAALLLVVVAEVQGRAYERAAAMKASLAPSK